MESYRPPLMTAPLTDVQWAQLQEAWRVVDSDADGLITAGDLQLLLQTHGFDHSESELRAYLNDLPINLEKDGALDRAQFLLWVLKLRERLMEEDREENVRKEIEIQDEIDSGEMLHARAVEKRNELAQMKFEREELEAVIEGELAANDKVLFEALDKDCNGYLSVHDVRLLAEEIGDKYSELEIDAMFHAVCAPGAGNKL